MSLALHHPHLQRLYEEATQPILMEWLRDNPDRAAQLNPEEIDELLSLQGVGGPLTQHGVEVFMQTIERKRVVMQKVSLLMGTEHINLVEQFIDVLYRDVTPYAGRA